MTSTKRRVLRSGGAWLARGLRVGVASVLVAGAFGVVAVRVSYARAAEAGMDFGDELRQITERHQSGDLTTDAYEVQLNGQSFSASNTDTSLPMHDVLDYFQAECQKDGLGLATRLAHLDPKLDGLAPAPSGVPGFFTIRREQQDRGFVFCMAADHELSGQEQAHRLRSASAGDFGKLGDVRYVSVLKEGTYANVVAAWTHGSFDIRAMFPEKGDAPGVDFGGLPRPDGARRILSGTVAGAPYGVNSFEVTGSSEDVMRGVNAKLVAAGWKETTVGPGVAKPSRFYSLGNETDVGVSVSPSSHGLVDVSYVVSKGIASVTQ